MAKAGMIKIFARLPEAKHFRQIQNRGDRYQWVDKSTDLLRIIASTPDPWTQPWDILFRIDQGKTRGGLYYPQRLGLVCLPPAGANNYCEILRERWKGNFAHSCEPTLFFSSFPVNSEQSWLHISVLQLYASVVSDQIVDISTKVKTMKGDIYELSSMPFLMSCSLEIGQKWNPLFGEQIYPKD